MFDDKNEKFELFEDLFHTMLKMQPKTTRAVKINNFLAHLRKEAIKTFRNMNATSKGTLEGVLIVFHQKDVKLESRTTAKHKWHKLSFHPNKKSLSDFLDELNGYEERAFGDEDQQLIDSFL